MIQRPDLTSEDGDSYRKSVEEAEALYREDPVRGHQILQGLADQGSVTAMVAIAVGYQRGCGGPADIENAIAWYGRAVDKGSLDALYCLGGLYWGQSNITQAQRTLEQGKARGCRRCDELLRELANEVREEAEWPLVQAALITRKTDAGKGLAELEGLADRGLMQAMLYVAEAYHKGKGTPVDRSQAELWYERAYQEGGRTTKNRAACRLGWLYRSAGDDAHAYKAFRCGADRGHVSCLRMLAYMHRKGLGCKRDLKQACKFLEQAIDGGSVFASRDLAYLLLRGTWGWRSRIRGFILLLRTVVRAAPIACRNPKDPRLEE